MQLTVIIPVLNGEKYISRCIDCISSMVIEDLDVDILVIDNGSNDSTIEIVKSKNVQFKVYDTLNISGLRNMGVRFTNADYIGFVDSDCLVDKKWAVEAVNILNSADKIGIVGRFYDVGDDPTWVEHAWVNRRKSIEGPVDFLPAGNMVIKRKLFVELGGFSNNLVTGEDYEICERVRAAGYSIINSPSVNVNHLGNVKKLRDIIIKERWYGLGMFSGINILKSKPLIICLIFNLLWLSLFISIFVSTAYTIILLFIMFIYILTISFYFNKAIKKKGITQIIKFMPISTCYLLGRTLSLIDITISKIRI